MRTRSISLLCAALFAAWLAGCAGLDNGLGRTPQMGWNSWNHFGCNVNESVIRSAADALVQTGLAAVGYTYVNIDDCWASGRDPKGTIIVDPAAFPSGMRALADYIHRLGLKFGVYSDAGYQTCAGRPGSLGYETNDASSYASWTVDYLKYDNCNTDGSSPEARYPIMRDALNKTGRPIFFSMCEWGVDNPATWARSVGNSWRTTPDIQNTFGSMYFNLLSNNQWANYSGAGGWNDPDMLEAGNGGLSPDEEAAHFALWALVKAPLVLGCDLTSMSARLLDLLSNTEIIAVNQDPLGVQGALVSDDDGLQVWGGPLADGAVAAVLFNLNDGAAPANITARFSDLSLGASMAFARSLIDRRDLGVFEESITAEVPSHDAVMLKLFPIDQPPRARTRKQWRRQLI